MGNVSQFPKRKEEELPVVKFETVELKKFTQKPNSLGQVVGQLVIEIESDTPKDDFADISKLLGTFCSLEIKGSTVRITDL
ncbi:MAG: hypothetical protein WDA41_10285 [Candidatus Neomarinimicrobiota bacterium]|jgi:hypothetical protein